jgi:hypothetical protein
MSNIVAKCCRKKNYKSHYVTVCVLFDKFSGYSPVILVKGTSQSICRWEEAGKHLA